MAALRAYAIAVETGASAYAVRIEAGGHVLTGDEPVESGGLDLGPAPFDLLSAALAECTAMTIRWYARQQGWTVEGVDVAVRYSKRVLPGESSPVDHFEKTVTIRGGGDLTDEQRTRLLNIAGKCPVHRTLEATPTIRTLVGGAADAAAG